MAVVSIILAVSLAANGYLYLYADRSSNAQVAVLENKISILETQSANLQNQISELQNRSNNINGTVAALNSQIANLQRENENLNAQLQNNFSSDVYEPYLVTALGSKYTWSPNSDGKMVYYLYIQGNVTNVGNGTAYNCALRIVTNSAKDSFTDHYRFNALAPGEHMDVDFHLYHVDLVNWTITPESTKTFG